MKLYIRPGPGPAIQIQDTILFGQTEVATACRGSFDSAPYEPKTQTWHYTAELHQRASDNILWIVVTAFDTSVEIQDGDWVTSTTEALSFYTSEDDGATWVQTKEPSLGLNENTRIHSVHA